MQRFPVQGKYRGCSGSVLKCTQELAGSTTDLEHSVFGAWAGHYWGSPLVLRGILQEWFDPVVGSRMQKIWMTSWAGWRSHLRSSCLLVLSLVLLGRGHEESRCLRVISRLWECSEGDSSLGETSPMERWHCPKNSSLQLIAETSLLVQWRHGRDRLTVVGRLAEDRCSKETDIDWVKMKLHRREGWKMVPELGGTQNCCTNTNVDRRVYRNFL